MSLHTEPPSDRRAFDRFTGFVLAHKLWVAGFWLLMTVAGFYGASQVSAALDSGFSMPDSASADANAELAERFGVDGSEPPLVVVLELPAGASADALTFRDTLTGLERELERAVPGGLVASYGSTGDPAFLSQDGRTTFAVVHPPAAPPGGDEPEVSDLVEAVGAAIGASDLGGATAQLTGQEVLAEGSSEPEQESGGGVLNETLIAGVAALVVLAFVFASALALVPLLMAVVIIPVTLLAVWGLTAVADVSFIVQFLIALIGLGIAIDYALIVVMRWRGERDAGADNDTAVRRAMATAGRAVVLSGTTVAISLLAAVVIPVPFLQSLGYAGLLIPLISVAVALTLLPVVLAAVGPFADRKRLRRTDRADEHWASWARLVVRRRVPAALVGSAVLLALCFAATQMTLGEPRATALASSGGPAADGLATLDRAGIGTSALAPVLTVVAEDDATRVRDLAAGFDGVRGAVVPAGPQWQQNDRAIVSVFPKAADVESNGVAATVERLRTTGVSDVAVGGGAAQEKDFRDAVYGSFPLMVALISLVTFVLLARAFRSIVLPLKAIALNLISVIATWGVITLVWQMGFGAEQVFGFGETGAVVVWVPLIVFAFLYGLSIDYEVFLLARIREEYDEIGSTNEAIVRGIGRTGRLVTSAALIIFCAFAMMGSTGPIDIRMLATGLAAGVLIDALVVRTLLVPALVSLLGRWNWWMPDPARRLLLLPRHSAPTTAQVTA